MASLLLCCTDEDEVASSCSICMMASIRCSGRVFQALSCPDSGEVSWTFSAVLGPTGIKGCLEAGDKSGDSCCINGLTVFCGRKKPSSPERLWPTSAGWSDDASRSNSRLLRGQCMCIVSQQESQIDKGADEDHGIGVDGITYVNFVLLKLIAMSTHPGMHQLDAAMLRILCCVVYQFVRWCTRRWCRGNRHLFVFWHSKSISHDADSACKCYSTSLYRPLHPKKLAQSP